MWIDALNLHSERGEVAFGAVKVDRVCREVITAPKVSG